jgi:hypothetical protein
MSQADKEQVLEDFSAAYKKAHGKQPKVEAANGWYSVDGGKNMRLAQLQEWTQELKSGKSDDTKPAAKSSPKKAKPGSPGNTKQKAAKSSSASKKSTKKSAKQGASGGKTPHQLWREHLAAQAGAGRLPRGVSQG